MYISSDDYDGPCVNDSASSTRHRPPQIPNSKRTSSSQWQIPPLQIPSAPSSRPQRAVVAVANSEFEAAPDSPFRCSIAVGPVESAKGGIATSSAKHFQFFLCRRKANVFGQQFLEDRGCLLADSSEKRSACTRKGVTSGAEARRSPLVAKDPRDPPIACRHSYCRICRRRHFAFPWSPPPPPPPRICCRRQPPFLFSRNNALRHSDCVAAHSCCRQSFRDSIFIPPNQPTQSANEGCDDSIGTTRRTNVGRRRRLRSTIRLG